MKSRLLTIVGLTLLPALFISPAAIAAPIIAEQILIDADLPQAANVNGSSVAIDGQWGFVGAPADNTNNGGNYCQVYVYKFDYVTGLWGDGGGAVANPGAPTAGLPYTRLRETGSCQTAEYGGFGASISASNGLLAVGAPLAKQGGQIRGGKIFFYQYDPTQITNGTGGWVWDVNFGLAQDANGNSDIQNGAAYGTVVSIRFDTTTNTGILLGGAPLYDGAAGLDTGKIYLYQYTAGATAGTGTVVFINSQEGAVADDRFGRAVTSNGVNFLVGAPQHDSGGVLNNGAGYLYSFSGSTITEEQIIIPLNVAEQNTGISVSLSPGLSPTDLTSSVMLLGGSDSTQHLYNGLSNPDGPYSPLAIGTKVGTANGDVSQDGNTAGFGFQGDRVELYYDKQNISGTPDWDYTLRSGEPEYGRDISVSGTRVMVNGNGNTTEGDGEGVAYAYYTASCYNGGELKALEWTMIDLQCDTSVASSGNPATIDEIFSPTLGIYNTNWAIYKQNGIDYEGHNNAYTLLSSTDVMIQGQGYWIIADTDVSWSIPAAIGDLATQTVRITDPIPDSSRSVRVGAVFPNLGLRAMLGQPDLPRIADLTEDMRVMFANPYTTAFRWGDTLFNPGPTAAPENVGTATSWFEGGDSSAYVYNTGVGTQNGYTAITAVGTPGMPTDINPGEGIFIKFSDTFHQDVLINVVSEVYLQLPLAK